MAHEHKHQHEHSCGSDACQRDHGSGIGRNTLIRITLAVIIFIIGLFTSPHYKLLVFLTAYILAGGDVIFRAIRNIIKGKVFDENFLMGIATIGAFCINEYPEAVMVMILYQIGEMFQHYAVDKSRKSITELMDIRPDYANIEKDGKLIRVSPVNVSIGSIIIVKTGEKIPIDGTVTDGSAILDTSALTGESVPRKIKAGDNAISGCINLDGVIKIKTKKGFEESTAAKILELVENASAKKAKTENFITKFARIYTPVVVILALILAIVPPLIINGTQFSDWLQRSLTFLVISCPCALVISVPLGFFAGIGCASKNGILIKGSSFIEALSKPETIVFDKTGTLTKGLFSVTEIHPVNISEEELLRYTAYAENYSSHPIALSIKKAFGKEINSASVQEVREIAGNGIKAKVDGIEVLAGNSRLMEEFHIKFKKENISGTIVYTAINGEYAGYTVISDQIKEDAEIAVKNLKNYAEQIIMLTGDTVQAANDIGNKLKLDKIYSQLLPDQKVEKLEEIIEQKHKNRSVIFAGDGINDAPVLTRADVGIAMGALGTDAAIEAADVVIMDDKPSKIADAIKISKKTMLIVKENIFFAIGTKILFLTLGAFGLVTMWGAVFADVGVSVTAILNSLRALKK